MGLFGLFGRSEAATDPAKYTRKQATAAAERLEVLSTREMQAGRTKQGSAIWLSAHRYRKIARQARR